MCCFLVLCSRLVLCPILCAILNSNVMTLRDSITMQTSRILWLCCQSQDDKLIWTNIRMSWDAACVFYKRTQGMRSCFTRSLSWWETKAVYCKCRNSQEGLSTHVMRGSCQCIQVKMLAILSKLAVVIETTLLCPVSPRRACTYSYIQVFNDFVIDFFIATLLCPINFHIQFQIFWIGCFVI